jgi:Uma2 family endonuclease
MSAATATEQPSDESFPLTVIADEIMDRHPGYRVEIIGGHLLVSPLRDAPHAHVLTDLMCLFIAAGLHDDDTEVLQNVGLWLPTGAEDYAIPDLAIVDADIDDHLVENNAYDPVCFRLVLEVTSSNWKDDLKTKAVAYAQAKVPVYVVVDRKHRRVHVLTDPNGEKYEHHRPYSPGETATLPDSIGAEVTLDVDRILKAAQRKTD